MAGNGAELFPYRRPHDLFELARKHYRLKLVCKTCSHAHVFDGHAAWWLFSRRYWDTRLSQIGQRFYCARCFASSGRKVRRPTVNETNEEPTPPHLPMPDEDLWRRYYRSRRT